jgi:endonuclease III
MTRGKSNPPRRPSKSGSHTAAKAIRGGTKPLKTSTALKAKPPKKLAAKKAAAKTSAIKRPKGYDPIAPTRVADILRILNETYPNVRCALHHNNAWELLVATILSAQCTDVRVNMVTPALFKKYPTPKHFAALQPEELEPDIRSTGFFRNKSKSVVGAAREVVEKYGGKVPENMEQLLSLPGVARKTANVVLGSWFGRAEGVVVDTHVHRISRRLELTEENDPQKIEQDLMKILPRDKWIDFSHQVIHHGRALCVARTPKCAECPLEKLCHAADKTYSTVEIHATAQP